MHIPTQHDREAGRADATMTPMIDVVFLLLIFFLCSATFQINEQILPSSLRLESGSSSSKIEVPPELEDLEKVVVKVAWHAGEPAWQVSGETVASLADVGEILSKVAAVDAKIPVILDIADLVPLGHAIDVYDVSRAAGFSQIQFAATVGR